MIAAIALAAPPSLVTEQTLPAWANGTITRIWADPSDVVLQLSETVSVAPMLKYVPFFL